MKVYKNECVRCPREMGCLGDSCSNRNVPHLVCDKCEEETQLYHYDGQELCIDCIEEKLEKVTE